MWNFLEVEGDAIGEQQDAIREQQLKGPTAEVDASGEQPLKRINAIEADAIGE